MKLRTLLALCGASALALSRPHHAAMMASVGVVLLKVRDVVRFGLGAAAEVVRDVMGRV